MAVATTVAIERTERICIGLMKRWGARSRLSYARDWDCVVSLGAGIKNGGTERMQRIERILGKRQHTDYQATVSELLLTSEQIDAETRGDRARARRRLGRETASMPIQKLLLELRPERSGARREGSSPEQSSALSPSASASLRANRLSEQCAMRSAHCSLRISKCAVALASAQSAASAWSLRS